MLYRLKVNLLFWVTEVKQIFDWRFMAAATEVCFQLPRFIPLYQKKKDFFH